MSELFWLAIVAGVVPLVAALAKLAPGGALPASLPSLASTLLATLAFDLTFCWTELWLVLPKAWTPGLAPVLYHNDHDWTGSAPVVELLQATGALGTLVSGLAFVALLAKGSVSSPTGSVFVFWMAFEGLFQALSQFAIGALLPSNDVGRALAYLRFDPLARGALLVASLGGMALAGRALAAYAPTALAPRSDWLTRGIARALVITSAGVVLLSIPFRAPRDPVEVILVPALVSLMGCAWLLCGMAFARPVRRTPSGPLPIVLPTVLLVLLLLFFQLVLRPGIRF